MYGSHSAAEIVALVIFLGGVARNWLKIIAVVTSIRATRINDRLGSILLWGTILLKSCFIVEFQNFTIICWLSFAWLIFLKYQPIPTAVDVTEWYARTDEEGHAVGYNYETGEYTDDDPTVKDGESLALPPEDSTNRL